ncbi:hypothetical protein BpHYR1_046952 [Brachionus plicatilis]|uniref:Secreted protein n=1 Tax=Brachionus plicatilis TaxID=10195 RepID=A0A3M7PJ42_BRAPC|nr:hypothetical protein BpHYR1_046952 [Brachionus plicatilis]
MEFVLRLVMFVFGEAVSGRMESFSCKTKNWSRPPLKAGDQLRLALEWPTVSDLSWVGASGLDNGTS